MQHLASGVYPLIHNRVFTDPPRGALMRGEGMAWPLRPSDRSPKCVVLEALGCSASL